MTAQFLQIIDGRQCGYSTGFCRFLAVFFMREIVKITFKLVLNVYISFLYLSFWFWWLQKKYIFCKWTSEWRSACSIPQIQSSRASICNKWLVKLNTFQFTVLLRVNPNLFLLDQQRRSSSDDTSVHQIGQLFEFFLAFLLLFFCCLWITASKYSSFEFLFELLITKTRIIINIEIYFWNTAVDKQHTWAVPSMPWFTKCNKLKYSSRSFWMGVPDSRTRRLQLSATRAL